MEIRMNSIHTRKLVIAAQLYTILISFYWCDDLCLCVCITCIIVTHSLSD